VSHLNFFVVFASISSLFTETLLAFHVYFAADQIETIVCPIVAYCLLCPILAIWQSLSLSLSLSLAVFIWAHVSLLLSTPVWRRRHKWQQNGNLFLNESVRYGHES
jgi:hypothetical protein